MKSLKSSSALQTKKFAAFFGKKIFRQKNKKAALVIGLTGELGCGKTTFIQGFARALGIKHRLPSPTFVIMRNYKIPESRANYYSSLAHIDAYRIKKTKELLDLDFKKILSSPLNIVLIEWADKVKKIMPKNAIWLKFEHGKKENERAIRISNRFKIL